MQIYDDMTNTFGFFGQGGIGPGSHTLDEFVSSTDFSKVANILNKISWIVAYNEESTEGHISTFYGKVRFRDLDGTMSAFVDNTTASFGIELDFDTSDAVTIYEIFNGSTNTFDIPISDELLITTDPPYFRVEALLNTSALEVYRASYVGFDPPNIQVALYDCESGAQFDAADFAALSDYDLDICIFGFKAVNVAVL